MRVQAIKAKNVMTLMVDGESKVLVLTNAPTTGVRTADASLYLGGVPTEHVHQGLTTTGERV